MKIDAVEFEFTKGMNSSMSRGLAEQLRQFLERNGLEEDRSWYLLFYRDVIIENLLWPGYLPISFVLQEYLRGIETGHVQIVGNRVVEHKDAINAWMLHDYGRFQRRQCLYWKFDGKIKDFDAEAIGTCKIVRPKPVVAAKVAETMDLF